MKPIATTMIYILVMTFGAYAQSMNELSSSEARDGYELLFNGQDLSKWRSYRRDNPVSSWKIVPEGGHNVIEVTAGDRGHIFTRDFTYKNFDLKVDWKVPPVGNSGIFIRYLEIDAWAGSSGPEAQIVDIAHSDGKLPKHQAGTCYDMFPLRPEAREWWNPTNNWNEFRIIAFEDRVVHYGNGIKLVEYRFGSDEWKLAYAASKYSTKPQYGTIHEGAIYLQHHGELGIRFRNLRIKRLAGGENPWQAGSPYLTNNGLVNELTLADNLFPRKPGCPDQNYLEYDSGRTSDDRALCLTLKVPGCPDTAYVEFNPNRNVDDTALCLTPNKTSINSALKARPVRLEHSPGRITISFPFAWDYTVAIRSISGQTLYQRAFSHGESCELATKFLNRGVYTIETIAQGRRISRHRVILVE